jgi:CheY-like chemotaxis protein
MESGRERDEFLTIFCHELRAPLHALAGWSYLLRYGNPDEQMRAKAAEMIERGVRTQTQLLDDLLDVSRMASGLLHLELVPVNLAGVVEAAVEALRSSAESGGVHLESTVDGPIPLVRGDSHRLQQVVSNLISNAVTSTPPGGRVEVMLGRSGASVRVTVRDTGRGISAGLLPFVFDLVHPAEAGTGRARGAIGLRLTIVQNLVEQHGGTVRAESAGEGKGAVFSVDLPVTSTGNPEAASTRIGREAVGGSPPGPPASVGVDASSLRGLRVLVVDDEEDGRDLLLTILSQHGVEVTAVNSAAEALIAIERDRPDLLLSDIGMPRENGYTLVRKLRALSPERGGSTPAMAVTAFASEEDARRAREAGYQMHLPKPVEPADLLRALITLAAAKR